MKILVTGSSGFIGSYFIDHYANKYDIETFSFLNNNLKNLNLSKIDTIIHLSALVHQMDGAQKEEYYRVNVDQTLALAQKARQSGVKQFIFMSSVKVYGEESDTPYKEMTPCNPLDDYGKSKLEAENRLQEIENDDFAVSILRTPIVYGEGVKANILNLVKLVDKVPILPFASVNNRRSMVYIGNLCDMIDKLCQTGTSGTFLAGDDLPVSLTELIEMIAKAKKKKIFLINIPFFPMLLKRLKPDYYTRLYENLEIDNNWTKKILGFSNKIDTEGGIKRMVKEME